MKLISPKQRLTHMSKVKGRKIWLTALAAIVIAASLGYGINSYIKMQESKEVLLPKLPTHGDVAAQPRLTYSASLGQALPADAQSLPTSTCLPLAANWLTQENNLSGINYTASDWHNQKLYFPKESALWIDHTSAGCGATIKVHASLYPGMKIADKKPRRIEVLRVGWYGGAGARMLWESGPIKLKQQFTPSTRSLNRMIETKWPVTTEFTIGKDWTPGLYLVTSYNSAGEMESYAPLILRAPLASSPILLVNSTITWATYNTFGGRSAYTGPIDPTRERSTIVSMDRPLMGSAIRHIDRDAIALTQYLESQGIAADQVADTDLSNTPSIIKHYNALIFGGHPEYMTHNEFHAIIAARNLGINLAFFGANTAYWQVRLSPSPTGEQRHVTIYRDATLDPVTSPDQLTVQFSDKRINTPAALFTSERTSGVHVSGTMNLVQAPKWLKIPSGAALTGWSYNSEIDSLDNSSSGNPTAKIIFSGKFHFLNGSNKTLQPNVRNYEAQTIWYHTPSGSAVFVAGINYWSCELTTSCTEAQLSPANRAILDSVTNQVLALWSKRGIGKSLM